MARDVFVFLVKMYDIKSSKRNTPRYIRMLCHTPANKNVLFRFSRCSVPALSPFANKRRKTKSRAKPTPYNKIAKDILFIISLIDVNLRNTYATIRGGSIAQIG